MLVWEEPRTTQEEPAGVNPAHQKWREEFLKKLRHSGLLLEQVSKANTGESHVEEVKLPCQGRSYRSLRANRPITR